MFNLPPHIKSSCNLASASAVLVDILGYLPPAITVISGTLSSIWIAISIYESKTFKAIVARFKG
jgi:hypothetical protein